MLAQTNGFAGMRRGACGRRSILLHMPATPSEPSPGNSFRDDRVLCSWLARELPTAIGAAISGDLDDIGAHAAHAWRVARERSPHEPRLTHWDANGDRIDRIETTPTWQNGRALAARFGLVAAGHDGSHGEYARCDQFARVYLHHVASEFFTCALAMTDGAATALKASGNARLIGHAVPRLVSRDATSAWLSGQWMTELAGGSDVGSTATLARRDEAGHWRLHGRKWFTSAVIGEMALTLARPEGAGAGADALALFLVETRDAQGRWNGIRVDRLKDKLGTRELPTAEIHLDGTLATPVGELAHGVRLIAPMLNVTRLWNAACALATMRRCLALAIAYAHRREAFGRRLIDHPLHATTLADMQSTFEAAFHLVFHAAHLLGRVESGVASTTERACLRVLTPLAKLWTGKLAVRIASECCEVFGGAGYIEETGMPLLLRDAQVYPIWEGTTDVLALDVLRAISGSGLDPLHAHVERLLGEAESIDANTRLGAAIAVIRRALGAAREWLEHHPIGDARESGARGFAMTLARTVAAATLARHAARAGDGPAGRLAAVALARFIERPLARLDADANRGAIELLAPYSH